MGRNLVDEFNKWTCVHCGEEGNSQGDGCVFNPDPAKHLHCAEEGCQYAAPEAKREAMRELAKEIETKRIMIRRLAGSLGEELPSRAKAKEYLKSLLGRIEDLRRNPPGEASALDMMPPVYWPKELLLVYFDQALLDTP